MTADFLLPTPLSRKLYESVKDLPIIDFHNHLDLTCKAFDNLTKIWITPDPYKHRLMRMQGVPERLITGDASDYEKLEAWCGIFPMLAGTPVYDWCLFELSRVFGIDAIPSEKTAGEIWDAANAILPSLDAMGILNSFGVEYASPVASAADDVGMYASLPNYAPSLRGDDAVSPDAAFVKKLAAAAGMGILTLDDYIAALKLRLGAFYAVGCRVADHALDDGFRYVPDDGKNDLRFAAMLTGGEYDKAALTSHLLRILGGEYGMRGIVMQLHFGAMRFTSTRLRALAGAAGGFAGIGHVDLREIVRLLDDIEKISLPKTILFPLNPSQMEETAVLSGSFSKDGVPAIVSEGPAWWWCDHREGMTRLLDALTAYSSLSAFVGMTTDSRSVLSFVRHDYFRRIVCRWMADKFEAGEFGASEDALPIILRKICYENAKTMIGE